MSDDNQNQDAETQPTEAQTPAEPISDVSIQPNASTPTDLHPEAPESPTSDVPPIPVESQNGGVNEPESKPVELPKAPEITEDISEPIQAIPAQPAPAPLPPQAPQLQPLAQQDQRGFIKSQLIKAQAKIQFNKQKKLEKIIQLAQKKQTITNDDVQKLLRVSDATATRYLVKLVQQGHLARVGSPRDAKYQFLR